MPSSAVTPGVSSVLTGLPGSPSLPGLRMLVVDEKIRQHGFCRLCILKAFYNCYGLPFLYTLGAEGETPL